jgi:hypothetical protein
MAGLDSVWTRWRVGKAGGGATASGRAPASPHHAQQQEASTDLDGRVVDVERQVADDDFEGLAGKLALAGLDVGRRLGLTTVGGRRSGATVAGAGTTGSRGGAGGSLRGALGTGLRLLLVGRDHLLTSEERRGEEGWMRARERER